MATYRAVLFDLCDTLLHFDPQRLPLVEIGDQPTRTTARATYAVLPASPITFDMFFNTLRAVTDEIAAQRDRDHREITSQERFGRVLARLGLHASSDLAERLVAAHMTRVADALVLPDHHRAVLTELRRTYRLAVVTNFDHAPTVRALLRRDDLEAFFEVVVISGDIGWRKPHPAIFEAALTGLHISSVDAYFVGDNFDLDVVGARRAGITAAWYRKGRAPGGSDDGPTLADLSELPTLLAR